MVKFLSDQILHTKPILMKKLTRTILSLFAIVALFTALTSCQEDVVPSIDVPDTVMIDSLDETSETDPDDQDPGGKPRL